MLSKLDKTKVTFRPHYMPSFEKYLKYNIIRLNDVVFSYDNGKEFGHFPCFIFEKEVIKGQIEDCLLICFLEFLLEKFGSTYYFMWENSNEGFDPVLRTKYDDINLFEKLKVFYTHHNINEKQFIYHGGNLNLQKNSDLDFTNLFHIFMWHHNNFIKKELKENRNFEKKFLFLNRVAKNERIYLFENFSEDILNNSFYSINAENHSQYKKSISLEKNIVKQNKVWETNIDYFFENSFCNIVTESEFFSDNTHRISYTEDCLLFTEKIAKAFNSYQPFVLVGCYNSIKKLKELGFKTFNKYWDESYDDVYNDYKRLDAIIKTVETINSFSNQQIFDIYKEIKSDLIHNYELFWKFKNKEYNIKTFFPTPFSEMDCFWR